MARSRVATALCVLLLACLTTADSSLGVDETDGMGSEVRADSAPVRSGGQKFEFQAEVNRLMDIIINSLYSNKDIFLRELISNASDALDKIRYLALTDPKQLGNGDNNDSKLEVRVRANGTKNTLEIIDSGVGMTREDLIKNLGTIAKSGTSSFLEKATEAAKEGGADNSNLIGQFGVGFYSAYLVAERVTVTSKHNNDKQYIWESGAEQTFTIYEDTDGEPLGRGTKITLHMKEDAKEYLDQYKIQELVKKYSQFINFPIYLEMSEQVPIEEPESETEKDEEKNVEDNEEKPAEDEKEEEKTDDAAKEEEQKEEHDDIKVEDEEEGADTEKEEKEPKYETKLSWKLVNENKPIWTRDPKDVTEDEYRSFYDSISKMPGNPMARAHFKGEGDVEFRSILYIPDKPPVGLYGSDNELEKNAIRLFVRRVLVSDKFEDGLLPRYLGFLVGIVDSDDLPINVSREMLQQSKTLEMIRRKLIRKALEMIKSLMQQDEDDEENDDEDGAKADEEKEKDSEEQKEKHRYIKFWKAYGKSMKLGVIEDKPNRNRLAKLLRFRTSKCNLTDDNDWTSFDSYMERMKKEQTNIYYLSGESLDVIQKSPFLEKLLKKGYEVIYLHEPIDEHMMQSLPDYEGSKFIDVSKDNVELPGDDEKKAKEKVDSLKKAYKPLTRYLKKALGDKVSKVKLSTRLTTTPCVLSTERFGYSARMEIIMKAQAFANPDSFSYMTPKSKVMELNPHHPIIKEMLEMMTADKEDTEKKVEELGHLVYDTALVSSGYLMRDNDDFQKRMYRWISKSAGVDPDAPIVEDYSKAEKEEPSDKSDGDGEVNAEEEHDEL